MDSDINSLVKLYLENELLARGKDLAVDKTKKIAKTALGITIGVPTALISAIKVGELSGRKINQI